MGDCGAQAQSLARWAYWPAPNDTWLSFGYSHNPFFPTLVPSTFTLMPPFGSSPKSCVISFKQSHISPQLIIRCLFPTRCFIIVCLLTFTKLSLSIWLFKVVFERFIKWLINQPFQVSVSVCLIYLFSCFLSLFFPWIAINQLSLQVNTKTTEC